MPKKKSPAKKKSAGKKKSPAKKKSGAKKSSSKKKSPATKKSATKKKSPAKKASTKKKSAKKSSAKKASTTSTETMEAAGFEAVMSQNECLVWRQGEFRQRVREAVADWANEPPASILPGNTLGELAKGGPWNIGQQADLIQAVRNHQVFAPQFPQTSMGPLGQLVPGSTTVATWEKMVWRNQTPITPCIAFTD